MDYEFTTSVAVLILFAVWVSWLGRRLVRWCVSRRKDGRLSGWDRVGVLASIICLAVGLWFGAGELDRISGADQFKGPLGDNEMSRICYYRSTRPTAPQKFTECWVQEAKRVHESKARHWYVPLSHAVGLLALMWTLILPAVWLYRGFSHPSPSPPLST